MVDNSKPKAYFNWILFDEQFQPVKEGSNFSQVQGPDQVNPLSASVDISTLGWKKFRLALTRRNYLEWKCFDRKIFPRNI